MRAGETTDVVTYPGRLPVTRTVSFWPASAFDNRSVAFVAPVIGSPSAYQRYVRVARGSQVPVRAVTVWPTATVPAIRGLGATNRALATAAL